MFPSPLRRPCWQNSPSRNLQNEVVTLSSTEEELSPSASVFSRGFRWSSVAWEAAATASEGSRTSEGERSSSRSSSDRDSATSAFSRVEIEGASPTHRYRWKAPSAWITPERFAERGVPAAILLQAHWRGTMVRRLHRKRFMAAGVLVAQLRAWHLGREERKRFLGLRSKVMQLQRFIREWLSREQELPTTEVLVSCEASPEVMQEDQEERCQTPTKPGVVGHLRPALRGAARRKLLGEEVTLPGLKCCLKDSLSFSLRSPEKRKPRKSGSSPCQLQSEKMERMEVCPSPMKEVASPQPPLDSGALVLSELLAQGLLVEEPLDVCADSMDSQLMSALDAIRARGARVCFVARVSPKTSAAMAAAYQAARESLGPERLLWHGTSWECVPNIVRHGFNRAYAFNARHGSKLGRGVYFAEDPGYALRFAGKTQRTRAMLLAGVLLGKQTRGKEGLLEPPADSRGGFRFDSTCDDVKRPRVFCVFKDFQAIPLYLLQVTP